MELTHAGPKDVNREAELRRPSGVVCSDLLLDDFISLWRSSEKEPHPRTKRPIRYSTFQFGRQKRPGEMAGGRPGRGRPARERRRRRASTTERPSMRLRCRLAWRLRRRRDLKLWPRSL